MSNQDVVIRVEKIFFCTRHQLLATRYSEGSAFGLGLCAEGCFV